MLEYIFTNYNTIINQDTDRKYKGEEGNPVEGIAIQVEDKQCQGESGGNCQHYHKRFAPAEKDKNENSNAKYCNSHVEK